MSPMEITPAAFEDVLGIATVQIDSWQAAYGEILDAAWLAAQSDRDKADDRTTRWQSIIAAKASQTAVSRHEGCITGFVSFGKCRDEGAASSQGEIWALYVAPPAWGQGTGRALLAHAKFQLRAAGFSAVSLWVLSANHRGIKFYEACGFERVIGSEKSFELGGRQVEEVAYLRRIDE